MKREEEIVKKYFKSIGFENIEYEPNGNRTPDFVVNKKIAVEVRRLNQFHENKPLEKVTYNLVPKVIKQIESYGNNSHNRSSWVGINYARPIKYSKKIKDKIESILNLQSKNMDTHNFYEVSPNLGLDFFPSEKILERRYNLASYADFNEGGFVLGNIYKSLKLIIKEKTAPFRSEYKTWWLVLVDHIGNGLNESEIEQLRSYIDFYLSFDKVYIVSSIDFTKGIEL